MDVKDEDKLTNDLERRGPQAAIASSPSRAGAAGHEHDAPRGHGELCCGSGSSCAELRCNGVTESMSARLRVGSVAQRSIAISGAGRMAVPTANSPRRLSRVRLLAHCLVHLPTAPDMPIELACPLSAQLLRRCTSASRRAVADTAPGESAPSATPV